MIRQVRFSDAYTTSPFSEINKVMWPPDFCIKDIKHFIKSKCLISLIQLNNFTPKMFNGSRKREFGSNFWRNCYNSCRTVGQDLESVDQKVVLTECYSCIFLTRVILMMLHLICWSIILYIEKSLSFCLFVLICTINRLLYFLHMLEFLVKNITKGFN